MYYERLLLNHVRGPTSFENLLTVAKESRLLESDNIISKCLREVVTFKIRTALRSLFATILVHYNPTNVRCLWDTYYNDMFGDFQRRHSSTTEEQLQCTLKSINCYLESMDTMLTNMISLKSNNIYSKQNHMNVEK
ncbi:hypothetical protein H5410_056876 [Solanum commersonii]|uniref:Uncharacterized protein n=1 Tax=Solanum commersonii TaxID=4109 RepID=A0A9J5WPB0_SOLCO|nr:hypothetical protein H5410_056876 [Solanum commersonii]